MKTTRLAVLLLLAAFASTLGAAVCIPPAEGVFGNPTPPHWWDNVPPQSVYFQKLDDPRWVGAGVITYGDGSATQADFRALHGDATANFYLSWRVFLAPAMNANQNTLYLGLERAGGAGPMIISVGLPNLVPAAATTATITANALNADGSLGAAIDPLPSWLIDTTRVWINNPTANSFAVEMRVPKSAVQMTGSNFNMWYEVLIGTPSSPQFPFAFPRTSYMTPPSMLGQIATFPVPATPGAWDSFRVSTGPGDASCTGSGVSLDYYSIGTNNSPEYVVNYRKIPPGIPPAPVNTFFARATNKSGGTINTGELRARFRVANWGSMPGQESGVDPNVLWATIPGGDNIGNAGPIPNNTTATAANDNHFDWTLSNAEIAPFEDGTRSSDNCLLVELTSTTGLTFTNNSIRRNLAFVPASKFVHRAEISIKALTPISPVGRDVYLLIEPLNLPARVARKSDTGGQPGTEQPQSMTPAQYEQAMSNGQLTDEIMDATLPTYRVHVFHDSGTVLGGRPILTPQGGFGYRVIHDGDLIGWAHQTVGEDTTLTEIAPNFYKITKVPNDGVVHVITTIEAKEGNHSGRWRAFVAAGPNFPDGSLDGGFSLNAGIERLINNNLSIEGILGYHTFEGEAEGRFSFDVDAWQLSANAKYFFGSGALRPFLNGGVGVYRIDPPDDTSFATNIGAGLHYQVNSKWGVEAAYNLHNTDPLDWSTLQLGVRWFF